MDLKDSAILPSSAVALPSEWLLLSGEDRRSGPGYTIWRDWDQAAWIDGLLRYDSYNGGEETVPVVVVGIYLDAETSEPIGILVRKRLQDGLKDRFLVPLARISGLISLGEDRVILGHTAGMLGQVVSALEDRREATRDATSAVRNSATEYARVIGEKIAGMVPVVEPADSAMANRVDSLRR